MKEHYKHLAQAAALASIFSIGGKVAVDMITTPEPIITTSTSAPWQRLVAVQRDIVLVRQALGEVPTISFGGYDIYRHPDPYAARERIEEAIEVLPEDSRQPWALQSVAIDLQITKNTLDEDLVPQLTPVTSAPYSSYSSYYGPPWSSERAWLDTSDGDIESAQVIYYKPKQHKKNK